MTKPKLALVNPGSSPDHAGRPGATRVRALDPFKFLNAPEEVARLSKEDARLLLVAFQTLASRIGVTERALLMRLSEPDPQAEPDEVLTVAEAAKLLGDRKESYVAELIRKRQIPAVNMPSTKAGKKGKYTGILKSSLLAWAKAHEDAGVK
jgi:hypothetical protein